MPRLWTQTIETHRRSVRDAVLDTTAALVAERGVLSVTMSEIAEKTGIGRATLYKYFPDVGSILLAWHERTIASHLAELGELRDQENTAFERLAAVLDRYALILHEHRDHRESNLAALLHRGPHVAQAEEHLRQLFRELLVDAAHAGEVRDDASPDELTGYCLHALAAASALSSKAAVKRLVGITLAGIRTKDA